MNNPSDTPANKTVVLPFAVTFFVQTPQQAENLAQFLYHHGLNGYHTMAGTDKNRYSEHFLADFRFDEEGNNFFGIPREPVPEWQRINPSPPEQLPDEEF